MTRKLILTLNMVLLVFIVASAQDKKQKPLKLMYKDTSITTNELTIKLEDAVSTGVETKFRLKIINKSNDYIIYKPEESKFIINGKEMAAEEKWLIISPNESDFKIINLKGVYNDVKSYTFLLDGLYKVPADNNGITAPDFKLPPDQNDFTAGNFEVSLDKVTRKSERTDVRFKCKYKGDKIGFVSPSKAAVKMPDGKEYANAKTKDKPVLLTKGKEDDFTLQWKRMPGGKEMDMQKADMIIKWRATFREVTPTKVKSERFELNYDEAATAAKNK